MMNRFIACLFLSFLSLTGALAQDRTLLDRLYAGLSANCVEMEYSYSTRISGVKMNGSGSLQLQGEQWHMTGNGVEIWCDGKSLWTIDRGSKEVVIEDAGLDASSDALTNPAILFVRLDDAFAVKESRPSDDGKAVVYMLQPDDAISIEYVNIEIMKSDASLRSGSFALDDGTSVNITVKDMRLTEKRPADSFSQPDSFDASWIVTDLR